jgi:type IX secretion system PorP/SprF family membrane protein
VKKLLIIAPFLLSFAVFGQQRQQYTMYMLNNYVLNPAEGGTKEYAEIKAGFRKQWLGMQDSPLTYYASGHGFIGKKHHPGKIRTSQDRHHSVGGYLWKDVSGVTSDLSAFGSYGYNMSLLGDIRASFSVMGGVHQLTVDASGVNFKEDGDIWEGRVSQRIIPDMSAGVWLYASKWYGGLASHQMLRNKFDAGDAGVGKGPSRLRWHYYFTGGYLIQPTEMYQIIPSTMIKMAGTVKPSVDLNVKFRYNDTWWVGASHRIAESVSLFAGVLLMRKLEVSYGYDLTLSRLRSYNTGTHEVIMGWRFYKGGHIYCPEDFW